MSLGPLTCFRCGVADVDVRQYRDGLPPHHAKNHCSADSAPPRITAWMEVTPAIDDEHPAAANERLRACRIDADTVKLVVVKYRHPNWTVFEDFCVWGRFERDDTWKLMGSGERYTTSSIDVFLRAAPALAPLFK